MENFDRSILEQNVHRIFIVYPSLSSQSSNPVSTQHTRKTSVFSIQWTNRRKEPNVTLLGLVHILVARRSVSAGGGSDKGWWRLCDRPLRTETLCALTRSDSISQPLQTQKGRPDRPTMARMCWLQGRHVSPNSQRRIPAVVSICNGAYLSLAVSSQ